MTPWELFCDTFKDKWMALQPPNRKTPDYIKFIGDSRSIESNIRVIKVSNKFKIGPNRVDIGRIRKLRAALDDVSYYKIFENCTFIDDPGLEEKLNIIEAKLRLLS